MNAMLFFCLLPAVLMLAFILYVCHALDKQDAIVAKLRGE